MSKLPPGFRFHPTDEELVAYYLRKRVVNSRIEFDVIPDHDLYKCEPWDLPAKSRLPSWDSEWFFFSPRDRKYPNGSRTNRATEAGYWKATGRDRTVRSGEKPIGMKKTLVFYKGRAPHGERTDWLMHEYRLDNDKWEKTNLVQDGYVLCRVFKKNGFGPPQQANWDLLPDEVGRGNEQQTNWDLATDEVGGERNSFTGDGSNGALTVIPANEVKQSPGQITQVGTTEDCKEESFQGGSHLENKQCISAPGGDEQPPFLQYRPRAVKTEDGTFVYQPISPPVFPGWPSKDAPEPGVKKEDVPALSEDENTSFEASPGSSWGNDDNYGQTVLDYGRGDGIFPSGNLALFNKTWLDEQQQGSDASSIFNYVPKSADFLNMLPPVTDESEFWYEFDLPTLQEEASPNAAVDCMSEDVVESETSSSNIQIRHRQTTHIEQNWGWTANSRRLHMKRFAVGDEVGRGTSLDSSSFAPASERKVSDDAIAGDELEDSASGLTEIEETTQSNSWAAEMIIPPASETSAMEEKDIIVGLLPPENIVREPSLPAAPVRPALPDSPFVEPESHFHPASPLALAEEISPSQPKSDKDTFSSHPIDGKLSVINSEDIVSGNDDKSKTDDVGQEAYVGGLLQLIVQPIIATAAASYSSTDLQRSKFHGTAASIGSMRVNLVTIHTCACQREVDRKQVQSTFNCFCYPDSQQIYDCGEKTQKAALAEAEVAAAKAVDLVKSTTATPAVAIKGEANNRKAFVLIFLLGVLSASAFFVLSKFCKQVQNGLYFTS